MKAVTSAQAIPSYKTYTSFIIILTSTTSFKIPCNVSSNCEYRTGIAHCLTIHPQITSSELLDLDNGEEALEDYTNNPPSADEEELRYQPQSRKQRGRSSKMTSTRPNRQAPRHEKGMVSTIANVDGSDEEMSDGITVAATRTRGRKRKQDDLFAEQDQDSDASEDELAKPTRTGLRGVKSSGRNTRTRRVSTGLTEDDEDEDDVDSDGLPFLQSDLSGTKRRRTKQRGKPEKVKRQAEPGVRQSGRSTRHTGAMQEVEVDDIYRSESDEPRMPAKPKQLGVREVFKRRPRGDEFHMRHNPYCEVCGQGSNFAPLIDCQGCTLVYHKSCIGHRTGREHLVTKIDEDDFVLQCRRCLGVAHKKDPMAPDQGKCQDCHHHGTACKPFRPRKTPAQEQKEREDNDGVNPSYVVREDRLNNADNVLFRCTNCFRGFHFEHLPSRADYPTMDIGEADVEQRFREYSRDWQCKECAEMPAKVSGLVAWKPVDEDTYDSTLGVESVEEEHKVYLVRWEGMSYFRAKWMPGPWVFGVAAHSMRKAFFKREEAQHPKMRTEDAIPEDYLRTDIVLDIKFTSIVDIHTEEVDKARIREVDKALIKYKGLTYEDAVWEAPPSPEDGDRWSDFVMAYNDWVAGRYVRTPKPSALKSRLEKVRREEFNKLEKTTQPDNVQGGTLMEYQVQGLNWLYYKWFCQSNAVLADEMGLGKTIQIIGFLATLIQDHNCFPFLVVVPNSTCPNWRREIKRWAPGLRVVAYYGSRESRDLAQRYELYPDGSKDLRCHIVVTSYDAAADENCRKFFKSVPWQGLIVDEGQRLKNDKNQLYAALSALKTPFKILLTGTPLQNNQRELFNLLHFLDDTKNAAQLEERFQDLNETNLGELHDMIRPYFLRRTKAQVLTFLPPMSQIIVPVSMTIVQKKLYRTIMAKNPELMRQIFSNDPGVKEKEKGSLSNILMQLRKCLCHPFVYNKSIEDKSVDIASSHRNLVDASSKLKLLEILLPKLRERGHRVLIFSQFLDMLDMVEDFMDGMQMRYQRLDGQISSLNKQKRIDEFNAPNSALFAFLLSTRAGGVGINLATADTVIILDPDFNPHQDIQALSRAHRIGQNKKVLCFQLVTRDSAEEKIMQIGKKKLALDHVLIQGMDAEEADQGDLISVLKHGASKVFSDDDSHDVVYDVPSVARLLDRSHIESTGANKSAETQFSFARVWANDQGALEEVPIEAQETAPDTGVWENILKERERLAADEAAAKAEAFGRGRRARANVDYAGEERPDGVPGDGMTLTPIKRRNKKRREDGESDTDFQADDSEDDDADPGAEGLERGDLDLVNGGQSVKKIGKQPLITPKNTPKKLAKAIKATPNTSKASPKVKATPKTKAKATPKTAPPMSRPFVNSPAAAMKPQGLSALKKRAKKQLTSNFELAPGGDKNLVELPVSRRWNFDALQTVKTTTKKTTPKAKVVKSTKKPAGSNNPGTGTFFGDIIDLISSDEEGPAPDKTPSKPSLPRSIAPAPAPAPTLAPAPSAQDTPNITLLRL